MSGPASPRGLWAALTPAQKDRAHGGMHVVEKRLAEIVRSCAWRLRGGRVQEDDLRQVGRVALCKAAMRFEEARNTSFDDYASACVRGAMLDGLDVEGVQENIKRSAFRAAAFYLASYRDDFNCLKHDEAEAERRADKLFDDLAAVTFYASADEAMRRDDEDGTAARDEHELAMEIVGAVFVQLADEEKRALAFLFEKHFSLEDTAEAMGSTVSRVRTLTARALRKLRDELHAQGIDQAPSLPAIASDAVFLGRSEPGNDAGPSSSRGPE